MKNRKAQIGDTITWFAATIAIMVILAISIFASSFAFGKGGGVNFIKTTDVLATKSLFSYVLTKDANGKMIYTELKEEENMNKFNGELASSIFKGFYRNEYGSLWFGIVYGASRTFGSSVTNDYFGARIMKDSDVLTFAEVKLKENKYLRLDISKSAFTK
jgi:hypothetical protein